MVVVGGTCEFRMPEEHPVVPGLRMAEVAVVLAGALAGSRVPRRLPAGRILSVLARGVAQCGGLDGVRRLTERNRLMNVQERTRPLTSDQRRERRVIWSGGRRREYAVIDLAFEVVNTPHDWHAAASMSGPTGDAG